MTASPPRPPAPRRRFRVSQDELARDRQLQARGIPLATLPDPRDPTPPHPRCHGVMVVEPDERARGWWCYLCLACGRRSPTYRRRPPPPAPEPEPPPGPEPEPPAARPPRRRRKLTLACLAARRAQVAALWQAGVPVNAIALRLGWAHSVISYDLAYLRAQGLLPPPAAPGR